MNKHVISMNEFAKLINDLLQSDRDVIMGVGGMTGVGKSTFTTKIQKEYATVSNTYWGFDRMTWDREELMEWIDGKKDDKSKQLPEFSAITADELFKMFYRRTWFDDGQIDAIATFNMCRDRHLFLGGNIPNFWDLDGAFQKRVRFYVYIAERGVAWVFEQENNPFTSDPWNVSENMKMFRRYKNPYKCPNFSFEIRFDDWDDKDKKDYLKIRNTKRVEAIENSKKKKDLKDEKDLWKVRAGAAYNFLYTKKKMSYKKISQECPPISDKTVVSAINHYINYYGKFE